MSKKLNIALAIFSVAALSSCSKMGPLSADNFTVTPSPLEAQAGKVDVTINGRFPEKYMKRKAVVTVTPVLKYAGQTTEGQSATFQGEKVEGNNQTISYKVGGNYTMKNSFKYVPDMQKSELYLTFDAKKGKKTVKIPEVKIADGVLATSELLKRTLASANPAVAPDAFEHVIAQKQEASINFLIQQAKIRNSELKKTSVQEFVETLRDIKADQKRKELNNVEISAYASPDGGVELNDKLAAKRESTTRDYVDNVLKKQEIDTHVDAKYTAQDWEGFQQLVSASNIQDKEVILRVLSMYKDPEQREQQIKNISSAFRELADEILPQLRRSRLTINYELIGRSDQQIKDQYAADATQLSVDEMLYAAADAAAGKNNPVAYINAVLSSWKAQGVTTPAETSQHASERGGESSKAVIERHYFDLRAEARRRAENMQARAMKDEAYAAIKKKLNSLSIKLAFAEVNDEALAARISDEMARLESDADKRLSAIGIDKSALVPWYKCKLCNDTGYDGSGKQCACLKKFIADNGL